MTAHPYPITVVEAVAKAIHDHQEDPEFWGSHGWGDLSKNAQETFIDLADAALTALWEASRVDELSEVEQSPNDAVLRTAYGQVEFARTLKFLIRPSNYPAHVLYWGDPV